MATTTLKTRIQHKYDTASNWASSNLVPLEGELVIYKGDKPQIKIGDGSTTVGNLPFIKAGSDTTITQALTSGTEIGSISIDGVATKLYAPSTIAWSSVTSKPSYYDAKAIKSISRSGTTFTATHLDGTTSTFTQQDNNTTYSAGTGLSLSGTTFSNSGVRSISSGSSNGTISVNTNGTSTNVAVKGLGSNAYTSTTFLPVQATNSTLILGGKSQGGTSGTAGYVEVIKITVNSSYKNMPFEVVIARRGETSLQRLFISFNNSSTATATTLRSFYVLGTSNTFYIQSNGNGVFTLIAAKTEGYDNICIASITSGSYQVDGGLTFEYPNTMLTSLPSSYTQATYLPLYGAVWN